MKKSRVLLFVLLCLYFGIHLVANECNFIEGIAVVRPEDRDLNDYREIHKNLKWKTDPVTGEIIAYANVTVESMGESNPEHNNGALLQLEVLLGDTIIYQQPFVCVGGYDYAKAYDHMSYYVGYMSDYSALKIRAKTQVWGCYTDGTLIKYYQSYEHPFDLNITTPSVTYLVNGSHPKMTWNNQEIVQYYEIFMEVKHDGFSSGWTLWDTTPSTSYIDGITKTDGKFFHAPSDNWIAYKIRAVNASGVKTSFSVIGYYKIADTGGKLPPRY